MSKEDKIGKITNEKPVKIPLPFKEALVALLNTKSPKERIKQARRNKGPKSKDK